MDELQKDETISSSSGQVVELTNVQTIDETRPEPSRKRFTRTSNLVVLFSRRASPTNAPPSDTHESKSSSIVSPEVSLDLEMPQETQDRSADESPGEADSSLPPLPQRPSPSPQLLEIDDDLDDDLTEN